MQRRVCVAVPASPLIAIQTVSMLWCTLHPATWLEAVRAGFVSAHASMPGDMGSSLLPAEQVYDPCYVYTAAAESPFFPLMRRCTV